MSLSRKITGAVSVAFIALFEIAERADFIRAHLPTWITAHSDLSIIALLVGLCLYLIFSQDEKDKGNVSVALPPVKNSATGGAATATAEGGKIEQHIHLPSSATQVRRVVPSHNVQFMGFQSLFEDHDMAAFGLGFQNVAIPGKHIDSFPNAALKVAYYKEPSLELIAEVYPLTWWNEESDDVWIGVITKTAIVAYFIEGKWKVHYFNGLPADFRFQDRIQEVALPVGRLRIVATLFGKGNLSIPPTEGILTLDENGMAHFQQN
jgi:hypothetical protein